MNARLMFALVAFLPLFVSTIARAETVWIEGEDATRRDVSKHGWYDDVRKEGMSGHEWLSHYDGKKPGVATYEFQSPQAGEFTFWWRGNPSLSKASYALNGAASVVIDFADRRGEMMISKTPDHRSLAWVKVGKVALREGKNEITLRFESKIANHGGVDCFVFDNSGFVPSGANKPGKTGPAGSSDWFPVTFDTDTFSPDSVIDRSRDIEAPAGQHGFLQRDGNRLKFEKSSAPIQFWGCGANLEEGVYSREQLTQRARYLRKHGVTMIRQHPVESELGQLHDGKFDAQRLDHFDWWCAELKKQGIYMTWSVFYGQRIGPHDDYDAELFNELPVVDAKADMRNSYGLVNIEPRLQDLQWRYLEALLTHRNPYTGLRPIDDPALAVLEFQNEDCIFFYFPLNDLRSAKWPQHAKRLRQKFFAWVQAKYGSEDSVKKAWGGLRPADAWPSGELELMGAHHFASDGPAYEFKGQTARAGDFIHFLTDLQRGFYERREKQVRDLGYRAITVTSAWRAGGPAADPANLYCDTVGDMIDRHNYFGGGAGGHGIIPGEVHNESQLKQPGAHLLSMGLYQVEDRPFSTTEWTQMPPNQWKLEAAPLIAFYGLGLQGWDASYHFASSGAMPGEGWPRLHSYVTDTPHFIGQFPALSLAIAHKHIAEAPIAIGRRLSIDDLFTGVDPLQQDLSGGAHDIKNARGRLATPVEALAVGRVTARFEKAGDSEQSEPERVDLDRYWDKRAKTVRSMTDELWWDYGRERVLLRAAKSQAIVGRAAGETISLPAVTANVKTPFVSLIVTSLDDRPLAESRHVLITALARDKQTGATYSDDGKKLLALGGPPLLLEPVEATLSLAGDRPREVRPLDIYGVPKSESIPIDPSGSFTIGGRYRTYYYEVRR